jgi:fatty-acid desaturase
MSVDLLEQPAVISTPARPVANPDLEARSFMLGRAAQGGTLSTITIIFMVLFHIGAVAALFMFTWKALICSIILWVWASNIGIGMCYHRLLTHRGYRCPKWVEYFMTIGATLSL